MEAVFDHSIGLPTIVFYLPGPEPRIPTQQTPSLTPKDLLIVVSVGDAMREAALQALKRVEDREPEMRVERKTSLKWKDNTPLKAIFRKMSEMPITALSFGLTEGREDGITVFFLRTSLTVAEFQREIERSVD
jgi:hypothetical protein